MRERVREWESERGVSIDYNNSYLLVYEWEWESESERMREWESEWVREEYQ